MTYAIAQTRIARKRHRTFALIAAVLAYLCYLFVTFDLAGLAGRARLDNAAQLLRDSYSHKTHVTRDNRSGDTSVSIEGERKGVYPDDRWPEWVARDGNSTTMTVGAAQVRFDPDAVRLLVPDYGTVTIIPARSGVVLETPDGQVPEWISASDTRVGVTLPDARLTVTKARTEVFRYSLGWPLFFFTTDSPYHYMTWPQIGAAAVSGEAGAILSAFWNNEMWRHKDVAAAMFETLLMAFLGTLLAALISVPLAFVSARNFTPSRVAQFGIRRVFDFLRGVDGLIWTIILARAFGPGPITGSLAIFLTDTGSFGKLFSEALENTDKKQVEGLRSTGANALQRSRFGVLPQVAPVILSQVLYMFESNTRGATVIGAIVGGGIGLLLTQAIQTQKDWEDVAYYILLIVAMVTIMDMVSDWIRRKLIKG